MSAAKTVSNPRVHIEHRRAPLPPEAYLVVDLDWIKSGDVARGSMTEADLYTLAENALHIAGILRRENSR